MSAESLLNIVLSIGIVGAIALIIISKMRKQSIKELVEDLREAIAAIGAKKEN